MYVGWTLIYLGIVFTANSVWMIALFPLVVAYIHFVDIRKEEKLLERKFEINISNIEGECADISDPEYCNDSNVISAA